MKGPTRSSQCGRVKHRRTALCLPALLTLGLCLLPLHLARAGATTAGSTTLAVSSVSPNAGPVAGGTQVTIDGSGFIGVIAVDFGSQPAATFVVLGSDTIEAHTPPMAAGTVPVIVKTTSASSPAGTGNHFTYLPVPVISAVSPASGAQTGGTTVTINGSGFTGATEVSFGSSMTTDFTVWSTTEITTFAPPGSTGTVDVTVSTPGGTSAVNQADQFTYFAGTNPGFQVLGNHVIGPNGAVFVPYGSIVPCLGYAPLNDTAAHTNCGKDGNATNIANIRALASAWHADDVRIQVAQENLFAQSPYDASYLSMLDSEVQLANSLGMVATISLQEEVAPNGPVFPVASSVTFWDFMARHFENNPMVMFDLFNEPHLSPYSLSPTQTLWEIWRNGGFVDDLTAKECTGPAAQCVDTTFVGMQTLLTDIRSEGVNNIVIVEGIHDDQNLTGIPKYALSGSNLVYGIEPNLYKTTTKASWATDFGNLASTYPIFGESLVVFDSSALCNASAPTLLPAEFQYMQSIGMGSLVWGMVPGDLTTHSPTAPTNYGGVSKVTCTSPEPGTLPGPPEPTNTIGPGADAKAFFGAEAASRRLVNPVVSAVSAASAGRVTISGDHLGNTSDVTFNGVDAPSFLVVSGKEVEATIPAAGEGTTIGIITTSGSTTVMVPSAPSGLTVQPSNGSATASFDLVPGALSYTVSATDTTNPTSPVHIARGATSPLTVTGLTNGDSYTVAVSATNAVGTGATSAPVSNVVPVGALGIDYLSPAALPLASTEVVALTGNTFSTGMTLSISGKGVKVLDVTVQGPTTAYATIRVSATTAPGMRNVTAADSSGSVFACNNCLAIDALPKIRFLSPGAIAAGATGTVRVVGAHFQPGATVSFGPGISASVLSSSSTVIKLHVTVSTGLAAGTYDVTVRNPDGGSVECTTCFSVIPPPTLVSISPGSLSPGETASITLTGSGFASGLKIEGPAGVKFSNLAVVSTTTIVATVEVGSSASAVTDGPVKVTNDNSAGDGSVISNLLTVS